MPPDPVELFLVLLFLSDLLTACFERTVRVGAIAMDFHRFPQSEDQSKFNGGCSDFRATVD